MRHHLHTSDVACRANVLECSKLKNRCFSPYLPNFAQMAINKTHFVVYMLLLFIVVAGVFIVRVLVRHSLNSVHTNYVQKQKTGVVSYTQ